MDEQLRQRILDEVLELSRRNQRLEDDEFTLRDYMERTGRSRSYARKMLGDLVERGLLQVAKRHDPRYNAVVNAYSFPERHEAS